MHVERFLAMVEECQGGGTLVGELQRDEAARTCRAVLSALAPRLSRDDRRRLARELPFEIAAALGDVDADPGGPPPLSDVLVRVAQELELDEAIAVRRLSCVLCTVRVAISEGTWRSLPADVCALGAEDR
jgi:uncharacterized protein (DUF2267 family)